MRRALSWFALVVGVLLILGGAAVAVAFGPDNTITSDPERMSSDTGVVATRPEAISISGPTVEVVVTPRDGGEVFVGVARNIEVADYLDGVPRVQIDKVSWPWSFDRSAVSGQRTPAADPTALDWWLASDRSDESASVTLPLPDGPVDMVAMSLGQGGLDVDITVGLVQRGAFVGGLAVALVGIGAAGFGWLSRPRRAAPEES